MRTLMRRFSLLGVLALIASLTVAGFAVAQEGGTEDAPFANEEDDSFSWSFDEETNTIFWSLNLDEDCSEDGRGESECNETEVEPSDGEDANHGDVVSAFANELEEGPGVGCLIAEVATSDAGMPEDAETQDQSQGCPAGLYDWLQTFTGENAGDEPPPWLADQLPDKAGGNGAEGNANGGAANAPTDLPSQADPGGDE